MYDSRRQRIVLVGGRSQDGRTLNDMWFLPLAHGAVWTRADSTSFPPGPRWGAAASYDPDRDAVVLRFFEGRRFAEIGATLRLTDDAARMRVERALDKLCALLERRGVTSTSAVLAAALANQAVLAAPAGLVASVTGVALAGAIVVRNAASTGAWAALLSMKKLQVGIAGALALAGTAGFLVETKSNAALRNEVASLRARLKSPCKV